MESDSQDLYLQKIEEFVHDEDKIVTCTWLSRELNIPVCNTKQLLQTYVNDQRQNEPSSLCVSYIICGLLPENKGLTVALVQESQLSDKESLFETINSKSIYSVQKSKEFSTSALALVDHLAINNPPDSPLSGSVISKNCVKRTFKEKKFLPIKTNEIKEKPQKHSFFTKVTPKSDNKLENQLNTNSSKQSKPKQNGAGIASFFSKVPLKTDSKEIENVEVSPNKENKNHINIKNEQEKEEPEMVKEIKMEVDDSHVLPKIDGVSDIKDKPKTKRTAKRSRKDNKSEQTAKKRRRIIERDDSDSDDIFGGDQDEESDVIGNSEEEPEPVYKPTPVPAPKNKKRKLVEQRTMDEDGYFITKKVWVYESGSEEEMEDEKPVIKQETVEEKMNEKAIKKADSQENVSNNTKAKKGKKNSPSGNQPTLLNFFQKK